MHLNTPIGKIEAVEEDFVKLLALSPMIEVQFRNILLERALVEAHKKLAEPAPAQPAEGKKQNE